MIVGSKDEIKRIYISGPITNVKNWKKNFLLAEKKILELDKTFAVVNPLKISERIEKDFAKYEKTPDYQDYMREDIKLLADCNAICMLPGWKRSKGARLEYRIAKILNLTIIELWSVNEIMNYAKTLPVALKKNEVRNGSQIILTVYELPHGFCFSINCKLGRFIRSYYPTPKEESCKSVMDAQAVAISMMKSWVGKSRSAKERLSQFDLINYKQQELFDNL